MSITGSNTDEWPLIRANGCSATRREIDPKLSPDGSRLAWQAPVDGVMNIWVAPTDEISHAQPVTRMGGRARRAGTAGAQTGGSSCFSRTRTATKITVSTPSIPPTAKFAI